MQRPAAQSSRYAPSTSVHAVATFTVLINYLPIGKESAEKCVDRLIIIN